MEETKIALFEQKQVRRVWYQDGWYFSVIDIIGVLTDSTIPKRYWSDLKIKLRQEGSEVYEKIVQLKFLANDGKYYLSDAANIETMFRIIQSIPSPKAEPFKIWLAQVGRERLDEIQNPELAQDRARKYYELKGYPKSWIEKRLRGIAIRQELTNEWKNRGIKEQTEYAILTNEIAQATFDVSVNQHKKLKGLDVKNANQNLRDHMTDLELIFSMLGDKVTTEITKKDDAQGFMPCQNAAKRGGRVARNARLETEKEIGRKVVSKENYLSLSKKKRLKK